MEILAVRDLSFTYPLCREPAIDRLSFSAEKGEFVVLCGATGSGKSTLLRLLKRELAPLGEMSGEICYRSKPVGMLDARTAACRIGYVMQRPEQQIVTDKVWHELAFGLENTGVPTEIIRRRVSEMACYFGMEDWFEKSVADLSGGQKQLLSLASVMVMQPELLLLDEPTAQLDPIAAANFLSTIARLNREFSLTVIIAEHRLEEVIPSSDKLIALDGGKLAVCGKTREAVGLLTENKALLEGMPAAVRLFSRFGLRQPCPLTVREGRAFIEKNFGNEKPCLPQTDYIHATRAAVEFRSVFLRWSRELPDVLRGLTFTVFEGEIFCLLGGNGSGKTTTLAAAAGLVKPYAGSIRIFEKDLKGYRNQSLYRNCLALLPQDVQTVFLRNTVREELEDADAVRVPLPFDLTPLLDRHPYDLSGGQQQLVALAKALATDPKLLLLDEPTKGLDAHTKSGFIRVLRALKAKGVTIVAVTHDVEFAAACADRCGLVFGGEITSCDPPRRFFAGNSFYTTAINRMTRGYYEEAATVDDAEALCRLNERRCSE